MYASIGPKHRRRTGFSLVETLTVLLILSIVLLSALPSTTAMITRSQTTAALNRLVTAVNLARSTAVEYQTIATLCALKENGQCGASWSGTLTVFLDQNRDARQDQNEFVIRHIQAVTDDVTVKWRAFQNKQYLQMTPKGFTNYQNGNFVVCPVSGNTRQARQMVVNIQGRVRQNHAVNEEGFPVDRYGNVLRC